MGKSSLKKGQNSTLNDKLFTYLMVCFNFDRPAAEVMYFKLLKKMGTKVSVLDSVGLFSVATEKLDKALNDPKSTYSHQHELPITKGAGRKMEQVKIQSILSQMKPSDRILITLKYLLDFTYFQMAAIIGRREGALRTSLSRSVKRFGEYYKLSLASKSARVSATTVKNLLKKFTIYPAPTHLTDEKSEERKVDKNQSALTLSAQAKSSLSTKLMNTFKQYVYAFVAFAFVFAAIFYFNQNSYSYHLNKVNYSLEQIEAVFESDSSVPLQDKGEMIDEAVLNLAHSIEAAENIHHSETLLVALGDIAETQLEVNKALSKTIWSRETSASLDDFLDTLEVLMEQQKLLKQALSHVQSELDSGETDVNIDIETQLD